MASRTQLRLGQITGSFGDVEGGIIDTRSASSATDVASITLVSGSMVGVLSEIASSVLRLHGHDTFASNAFSTLKDLDGDTRITYAQGAGTTLHQDGGTEVLSIAGAGARVGITGSFFPEANRTRTLGSSTLQFVEIHGDLTGSVNGSVAGTGIANDRVVISNNGALEGDANFTFNGSTLTLGGGAGLSVDGSATIAGNLTVNGSTTTVSSSNTILADRVLAIASGSTNADVDSGLVFRRATADLGGGSDKRNGALLFDGATGNVFKLGVTNDDASTDTLTVADDDLADLYAGKLFLDGGSNSLDVVSSNLTAVAAGDFVVDATTDIVLDTDTGTILIKDGGTEIGRLLQDTGTNSLVLSSSVANDSITLAANSGEVFIADTAGGSSAGVNVSTANEIKFGHVSEGSHNVGFLNLKTSAVSVLSASSGLQIDAGAANAQLELLSNNANAVTLTTVSGLTAAYTLTLPPNDGDADQVLTTNGSGVLTFANASSAGNTKKAIRILAAGEAVAAGANLSFASANIDVGEDPGDLTTSRGVNGKLLDVYVNGQLLVSGSSSEISAPAPSRDYTIASSDNLQFAFDLEVDDIIQLIKRG